MRGFRGLRRAVLAKPGRSAWSSLLLALLMLACGYAADAVAREFTEGLQYQRVPRPQQLAPADKVVVQEFFWYGCPACNAFEPVLQRYAASAGEGVVVAQEASIANPHWGLLARAFYTAQVLGVLEQTHQPLFDAIHRQGRSFADRAALAAFFVEHGVPEDEFNRTFRSFAVQTRLNRSRQLALQYGIRGVPAVVVGGQYRTNRSMAGGNEELIEVIRFLVGKDQAAVEATPQ